MAFVTEKIISSSRKLICNYVELKLVIITLHVQYFSSQIPSDSLIDAHEFCSNFAVTVVGDEGDPCYLSFTTQKGDNSAACEETILL